MDKRQKYPVTHFQCAVVSDSRLLRDSLTASIAQLGYESYAMTAHEYLAADRQTDVILLDAYSASQFFFAELKEKAPQPKVLMLNSDLPEIDLAGCIRSGVGAFIAQEGSLQDVVETLRELLAGERVIPQAIVSKLCLQLQKVSASKLDVEMTHRERQILDLIVQGLTNKEIGSQLNIAEPTVKNHVHNLLHKLECRKRADVIRLYQRRVSGEREFQLP